MNEVQKKSIIKIVIFVIVMVAAGLFAYRYILEQRQEFVPPSVNPEAGLGAEGALCGGDKRLPCMPGNKCQITNEETNEGVCVHVTDDPGPAQPPEN